MTDLDAGLAVATQLCPDIVQECCRNAERNGIRCGWNHLVDRIMGLFNALDDQAPFARLAEVTNFEAQTAEQRGVRRQSKWTPARLVLV